MASTTASTRAALPLKIAFCITELDPGGAERALVELVTRIDRQRFEPVVYCLGERPAGNPTSLADRLEAAGIAVHFFDARRVWHLPRLLRTLRRRMELDRPSVLQTFLFHANVVGAWAARRAGVPHVVSGIRVAERRARGHLFVARWADRLVDRHVCVSGSVREYSLRIGKLPAEKLVEIPNAVDVDRFTGVEAATRQSLQVPPEAQVITSIGRLDHQKGLDWLLEVMRDVERRVPRAWLVLVGEGPQRQQLEDLARRLEIEGVRFLGYRADVPAILKGSDLVVLPSRWEGMPNVLLEAMAAGRAVVATDVEGVREVVGPQAADQIVAVDDPQGFGDQIVRLLSDEPFRERLAQANRERAAEAFSFSKSVEAYERLYLELAR